MTELIVVVVLIAALLNVVISVVATMVQAARACQSGRKLPAANGDAIWPR